MLFRSRRTNHSHRSAFTLVELLIVIGIIALLISILLPALTKARSSAQAIKCAATLRQMHLAFKMYSDDNNGFWPAPWAGAGFPDGGASIDWSYQWPYILYWYTLVHPRPLQHYECPLTGTFAHPNLAQYATMKSTVSPQSNPIMYCPTIVSSTDLMSQVSLLNQLMPVWTTWSMAMDAPAVDPGNPTVGPYDNIFGYPKWSSMKDSSDKIHLTDAVGSGASTVTNWLPWFDYNQAHVVSSTGVVSTYANNPHNKQSNVLWCDGHVSRMDLKTVTPSMFQTQGPCAYDPPVCTN